VNRPDEGSVTVEYEDDQITAVAWTHNGRRCSVGTAIIIKDEG
jgi:hypothetical protein